MTQAFRLADLTDERGVIVASTKYQVALVFPVPVEHVALPVLKQGEVKATVAGKVVYLDVARAGGRATLSVSLGDQGLAQFDVALTDQADGVTRYLVSEDGAPAARPVPAAPRKLDPQVRSAAAVPATAAARPVARPQPRVAATPVTPSASTSSLPARPTAVPRTGSVGASQALIQPLTTRGLVLTFTTRRDGPGTLITYRATGTATLRPEDLGIQDALGRPLPATVLQTSARPGELSGQVRVASDATLLRLHWVAKGADGAFFPVVKTLFVR